MAVVLAFDLLNECMTCQRVTAKLAEISPILSVYVLMTTSKASGLSDVCRFESQRADREERNQDKHSVHFKQVDNIQPLESTLFEKSVTVY